MRRAGPVTTDVVLVGGGHAHVQVMTRLAMAGVPGLRLTLVTEALDAPYSGMLPGHLAGQYTRDDVHIDLARLAFATGTRLVQARATGVDRAARRLALAGRPPLAYDLLSLNVGIVPDLAGIDDPFGRIIPVKPIAGLLERLDPELARLAQAGTPCRAIVVGGGAAGVELAFALRAKLRQAATAGGSGPDLHRVSIVTSAALLPTLADGARRHAERALAERGIAVHATGRVVAVDAAGVRLEDGRTIPADLVLVSTRARAPAWLAETGLDTAADGSVLIRPTLQSFTDDRVFAVGDCGSLAESPTEKAGVYAVRQGPALARNLARLAIGLVPKPWRPQRAFLVLLNTADGAAIASRGSWFSARGAWVWRWKDRIDRRFMRMFARFGRLGPAKPDASGEIPFDQRCGGCAAKIGPASLATALGRLPSSPDTPLSARVLRGLDRPDDAAVLRAPDGTLGVETIDLVRAFVDDPYLFGQIATLHALSDIHAMGARPVRALALAGLPHGRPASVAEDLFQLLAGARSVLDRENVLLLGGHSAEAADMALGLAVTGEGDDASLATRDAARPGDRLLLTKPLGTGIVFAAAMRGSAPSAAIAAALRSQGLSNRAAAQLFAREGVRAVTDITGFGLAGHGADMMAASGTIGRIDADRVPSLTGVDNLLDQGFASSLLSQTAAAFGGRVRLEDGTALPDRLARLLFDPQTSGGLLACVPAARADDVLAALLAAGHPCAALIGHVEDPGPAGEAGRIRVGRLA